MRAPNSSHYLSPSAPNFRTPVISVSRRSALYVSASGMWCDTCYLWIPACPVALFAPLPSHFHHACMCSFPGARATPPLRQMNVVGIHNQSSCVVVIAVLFFSFFPPPRRLPCHANIQSVATKKRGRGLCFNPIFWGPIQVNFECTLTLDCVGCVLFLPFSPLPPEKKSPAFHPFECHPFWSDLGLWAADAIALVRPVSTQSVGLLKALCFSTVFEHFRAVCPFFFCSSGGMLENPLVICSYGTFGYSHTHPPPHLCPPPRVAHTDGDLCPCRRRGAASLQRSGTKVLTVRDVGQKEVLSADCSQI